MQSRPPKQFNRILSIFILLVTIFFLHHQASAQNFACTDALYFTSSSNTNVYRYTPSANTLVQVTGVSINYGSTEGSAGSAITPSGSRLYYNDRVSTRRIRYNVGNTLNPIAVLQTDDSISAQRNAIDLSGNGFYMLGSATSPSTYYTYTTGGITSTTGGPFNFTLQPSTATAIINGGDFTFDANNIGYLVDQSRNFYRLNFTTNTSVFLGAISGMGTASPNGVGFSGTKLYISTLSNTIYEVDLTTLVATLRTPTSTPSGFSQNDIAACVYPNIFPTVTAAKAYRNVTKGDPATFATSSSANPGDTLEYRVVVRNTGSISAGNTTFLDAIPSGVTYVDNSTALNTVAVTDSAGTGNTRFFYKTAQSINGSGQGVGALKVDTTPGTLTDNEAVIIFRVTVNNPFDGTANPIPNTAQVNYAGASAVVNSNTVNTTVDLPDLTITKSHTGNFTIGSTGTYSFSVNNGGTVSSTGTITVTDTLPVGLTVNGGAVGTITEGGTNSANWTCNSAALTGSPAQQTITCTSSTAIAASGSSVFNFAVNVGASTAVGTNSITNTANVSGGGQTNTTNDSSSDPTTVVLPDTDYGDAPDTGTGTGSGNYNTLSTDSGASHTMVSGVYLGSRVDADSGSLQNADATADDLDGTSDDEDGVIINGDASQMMVLAKTTSTVSNTVNITASTAGFVNLWIDYNQDGDFLDTGERVFSDRAVVAGSQNLTFNAPTDLVPGYSFMRVRFTTGSGQATTPTGSATNGEVEDYRVKLRLDAIPLTCSLNQSAIITSLDLRRGVVSTSGFTNNRFTAIGAGVLPNGTVVDVRVTANGSVTSWVPNTGFIALTFAGGVNRTMTVEIFSTGTTTPASGSFIYNFGDVDGDNGDANTNGIGDDTPTMPVTSYSVNDEYHHMFNITDYELDLNTRLYRNTSTSVPADLFIESAAANNNDASLTDSQLTVRVSWDSVSSFQYSYFSGQFGGHRLDLSARNANVVSPNCSGRDFGDAPASYGAPNHGIVAGTQLGATIDDEITAQPNADANLDDTTDSDDEDGVTFPTNISLGSTLSVPVQVVGTSARLNAWIDWNRDGDFTDTGEQLANDQTVSTGTTNLSVTVPTDASVGDTYTRFRICTTAGLCNSPTSVTTTGEVEDYKTTISNSPDLTIAKSHTGDFTRGSTGTYTLTVGNGGTAVTSGTITVSDTLPTGLTIADGAVTVSGTNSADWSCSSTSNVITCTSTTAIAISGSSIFSFTVNVASNAAATVTNIADVSGGNEATAYNGNNSASDPTNTISSPPNVNLAKTCPAPADCTTAPQLPGTDVTYNIAFTNSGGLSAANMAIVDGIPANTDFKLSSVTTNVGTTGLTIVVEYSSDYDPLNPTLATWTYTPVSGGGTASVGYDRNVKAIRWRVTSGVLSSTSPNNTGNVGFVVKIR